MRTTRGCDHVAEPEPSVEALLADMKARREALNHHSQTRVLVPPTTSSGIREPGDRKQVALNMCSIVNIDSVS